MKKRTPEEARRGYLALKANGAYCGSVNDSSWDRAAKIHRCCGSRKSVYHRASCPVRSGDLSDVRLYEKPRPPAPDPASTAGLRLRIRELKEQGMNSGQVYAQLQHEGAQVTLAEVNRLYV